jgi:hypothetical protein
MDNQEKEQKLNIWQSRISQNLSSEDSRQITENLTGFFEALLQWQQREDGSCAMTVNP